MKLRSLLLIPALVAALTTLSPREAEAVDVHIYYRDAPGYGFNDPYLGHERRVAFELTMYAFAAVLHGNVPITVDTYFVYGVGAEWGYGDGWPNALWHDFPGGIAGVSYPVALANQKVYYDGDPANSDLTIIFNGDLDLYGGTRGERFYYGLNGFAGYDVDFITETAHGFLRGIGFYSMMDPYTGHYWPLEGEHIGYPDILTANLAFSKNPFWNKKSNPLISLKPKKRAKAVNGGHKLRWMGIGLSDAAGYLVPMYGPKKSKRSGYPYGVIDHFDPSFGYAELMYPYYTGPLHALNAAAFALWDMGWNFN